MMFNAPIALAILSRGEVDELNALGLKIVRDVIAEALDKNDTIVAWRAVETFLPKGLTVTPLLMHKICEGFAKKGNVDM